MIKGFSIFKVIGIFGTAMMLLLFFSGMIIGIISAVKQGDWEGVLTVTGGKLLSLDSTLKEETNFLIEESAQEDKNIYGVTFRLLYGVSILFMFFMLFYLLFRFGNWISGIKQLSPGTDLVIAFLIILAFFVIEFLYGLIVLEEIIYPLSGVWHFIKNLPLVVNNLI